MFQQRVGKECVLGPVCFPSSLGGLAHENEDPIPIMIRCEVRRYGAKFSRQKTVFQSSVILVGLSQGLYGQTYFYSSDPFLLRSPKEFF